MMCYVKPCYMRPRASTKRGVRFRKLIEDIEDPTVTALLIFFSFFLMVRIVASFKFRVFAM